MAVTKQEVVDFIKGMTVLELSEFVKELEADFRRQRSCPGRRGRDARGCRRSAPVEEQTEFSVIITGVGDKKINVIKEVRAITSLGLKEAKDLVEKVPGTVKEGIPKAEAEAIAKQLTEAGATVEIK